MNHSCFRPPWPGLCIHVDGWTKASRVFAKGDRVLVLNIPNWPNGRIGVAGHFMFARGIHFMFAAFICERTSVEFSCTSMDDMVRPVDSVPGSCAGDESGDGN